MDIHANSLCSVLQSIFTKCDQFKKKLKLQVLHLFPLFAYLYADIYFKKLRITHNLTASMGIKSPSSSQVLAEGSSICKVGPCKRTMMPSTAANLDRIKVLQWPIYTSNPH